MHFSRFICPELCEKRRLILGSKKLKITLYKRVIWPSSSYLTSWVFFFIKYFSALLTSSDLGRWGELGLITRSVIASYFLIQFHFGWEYWEGADLKRDYHRWLLVPVKIYFHLPLMFISQHFKGDFAFALVTCIRELRARINMMNMFVFWIVSIGNKKLPSYQNTCREMLHFYTERGNNNVLVLWPSNLNSKVKHFNIKINNKCCLTNKDWSKVV